MPILHTVELACFRENMNTVEGFRTNQEGRQGAEVPVNAEAARNAGVVKVRRRTRSLSPAGTARLVAIEQVDR